MVLFIVKAEAVKITKPEKGKLVHPKNYYIISEKGQRASNILFY
jgi:hypothetical protein